MTQTKKNLRKELEARLRFEKMLAEISTGFINMPVDKMDQAIQDTQRRVCDCLGLDRSTLWQFSEKEPDAFLLTHLHQPPGSPPVPDRMQAKDYFPWSVEKIVAGEMVAISKLSDLPPEAARDLESFRFHEMKSTLLVPLSVGGEAVFGALSFAVMQEEREWPELLVKQLSLVAQVFANALARKKAKDKLLSAFSEIEHLKEWVEAENIYLREDINMAQNFNELIGQSDGVRYVLYRMEQVADTDATVLILGETGTGK